MDCLSSRVVVESKRPRRYKHVHANETGRCRLKRLPVLINGELMKVRPECKAGCTPGQLWRR